MWVRAIQPISPPYYGRRAGIEGAPLTQTLSYNTALNESQLGYGFNIVNDKIGPISSTSFDVDGLIISPSINRGHRLALGLKFSVMNYFLDTSKIMTSQPNDAAFFLDTDRTVVPNIGFGAYYYTPSFIWALQCQGCWLMPIFDSNHITTLWGWSFAFFGAIHVETQLAFKASQSDCRL